MEAERTLQPWALYINGNHLESVPYLMEAERTLQPWALYINGNHLESVPYFMEAERTLQPWALYINGNHLESVPYFMEAERTLQPWALYINGNHLESIPYLMEAEPWWIRRTLLSALFSRGKTPKDLLRHTNCQADFIRGVAGGLARAHAKRSQMSRLSNQLKLIIQVTENRIFKMTQVQQSRSTKRSTQKKQTSRRSASPTQLKSKPATPISKSVTST
ncbi:hypothetical protein RRG08_064991 [Elysia crispata]|uniref:Uncharacterized protein n=1 Tax=Elysia crispata TaxID=231223 RepID=A0AAE0YAK2_9GAST|nr:hypothetical protein RRG08_064991 [Elysia crispata]